MSSSTEEILKAALALPTQERAALLGKTFDQFSIGPRP